MLILSYKKVNANRNYAKINNYFLGFIVNYLLKYPILLNNTHLVGYDYVSENEQELIDYYSILDNIISQCDANQIYMLDVNQITLIKDVDVLRLFTKNSILKLHKNIKYSSLVIKRLIQLKKAHYKIAIYFEANTNYENILEFINYIIVDVFTFNFYKKDIYALAKKIILTGVDTTELFDEYKDEDIVMFVGDFNYVKKETIEPYARQNDKMVILNLLNELETTYNVDKLVKIFARNTDITIKLLQYLNSSAIGLRTEVSSINQAITLLGKVQLTAWLGMFLYGEDETKFGSLLKMKIQNRITTVALFLEAISDIRNIQKGFLAASLSLADTIVNKPLDKLINSLSLDDVIKDAIIYKKGNIGEALTLAISLENKDQENIDKILEANLIKGKIKEQLYSIYNLAIKKEEKEESLFKRLIKKFKF